jgi:hypothetical protein
LACKPLSPPYGKVYYPVFRQFDGCPLIFANANLFQLCTHLGTELIPRHIPGKRNILADDVSRADRLVQTEWTLYRDVVRTLLGIDLLTVDLFATRLYKQLPLYYSPLPDDETLGVDSLSAFWEGLNAYAFPPTPLIFAVLNKTASCCVRLCLIAP